MIKIRLKSLNLAAYIWMYSGIVIFLVGYLKLYIGIPAALLVLAAFYFAFRKEDVRTFEINKGMLIAACVIIPIWMLVCGFCGIFDQAADWAGRNAQLYDLVTKSWPVYYSNGSAYTYYFGHFMFPALVGKIFGLGTAKVALWLYTSFAVLLTYLFVVKITHADTYKKQVIILLFLMFFSCGETLRELAINLSNGIIKHFDPSYSPKSYNAYITSNPVAYAWVFNQMTIAFLGLGMLFDDDTRIENAAFLTLPFVLYAPFPLCMFIFLVITMIVKSFVKNRKDIKPWLRRVFSVQNIAAIIFLAIIAAFLWGNISGEKPDSLSFSKYDYSGNIHIYIMIVVFEFLLYAACIFGRFKKNPYFWVCIAVMMILPLFKFGLYNDLCSRAAGTGSFLLMIFIIEFLFEKDKHIAPRWLKTVLAALVLISSVRGAVMYKSTIENTVSGWADGTFELSEYDTIHTYEGVDRLGIVDYSYNYFTFDAENDFFYKYLAKPPKDED